jgi:hypothetical protein
MDQRKYLGIDVHQASISIAVSDSSGKLVMDSVIEVASACCIRCRLPSAARSARRSSRIG